jgi:hypothetical protein
MIIVVRVSTIIYNDIYPIVETFVLIIFLVENVGVYFVKFSFIDYVMKE